MNKLDFPLVFSKGSPASLKSLNEKQLVCFLEYLWEYTGVPEITRLLPQEPIEESTRINLLRKAIENIYERQGCAYLLHLSEGLADCHKDYIIIEATHANWVNVWNVRCNKVIAKLPKTNLDYDKHLYEEVEAHINMTKPGENKDLFSSAPVDTHEKKTIKNSKPQSISTNSKPFASIKPLHLSDETSNVDKPFSPETAKQVDLPDSQTENEVDLPCPGAIKEVADSTSQPEKASNPPSLQIVKQVNPPVLRIVPGSVQKLGLSTPESSRKVYPPARQSVKEVIIPNSPILQKVNSPTAQTVKQVGPSTPQAVQKINLTTQTVRQVIPSTSQIVQKVNLPTIQTIRQVTPSTSMIIQKANLSTTQTVRQVPSTSNQSHKNNPPMLPTLRQAVPSSSRTVNEVNPPSPQTSRQGRPSLLKSLNVPQAIRLGSSCTLQAVNEINPASPQTLRQVSHLSPQAVKNMMHFMQSSPHIEKKIYPSTSQAASSDNYPFPTIQSVISLEDKGEKSNDIYEISDDEETHTEKDPLMSSDDEETYAAEPHADKDPLMISDDEETYAAETNVDKDPLMISDDEETHTYKDPLMISDDDETRAEEDPLVATEETHSEPVEEEEAESIDVNTTGMSNDEAESMDSSVIARSDNQAESRNVTMTPRSNNEDSPDSDVEIILVGNIPEPIKDPLSVAAEDDEESDVEYVGTIINKEPYLAANKRVLGSRPEPNVGANNRVAEKRKAPDVEANKVVPEKRRQSNARSVLRQPEDRQVPNVAANKKVAEKRREPRVSPLTRVPENGREPRTPSAAKEPGNQRQSTTPLASATNESRNRRELGTPLATRESGNHRELRRPSATRESGNRRESNLGSNRRPLRHQRDSNVSTNRRVPDNRRESHGGANRRAHENQQDQNVSANRWRLENRQETNLTANWRTDQHAQVENVIKEPDLSDLRAILGKSCEEQSGIMCVKCWPDTNVTYDLTNDDVDISDNEDEQIDVSSIIHSGKVTINIDPGEIEVWNRTPTYPENKTEFLEYFELCEPSNLPDEPIILPEVTKEDYTKYYKLPCVVAPLLASCGLVDKSVLTPGPPGQNSSYLSTDPDILKTRINPPRNVKSTFRMKNSDVQKARDYKFPKRTYRTRPPVPFPRKRKDESPERSTEEEKPSSCSMEYYTKKHKLKQAKIVLHRLNPAVIKYYTSLPF